MTTSSVDDGDVAIVEIELEEEDVAEFEFEVELQNKHHLVDTDHLRSPLFRLFDLKAIPVDRHRWAYLSKPSSYSDL